MNVDVIGRIRPCVRNEGVQNLELDAHNTLSSRPGGPSYTFSTLHRPEVSNYEVFKKSVEPMIELFVAGFNTSLIVTGESGSGKSYALAGEGLSKAGIVPLIMEHLFAKIGEDNRYMYENLVKSGRKVRMQMYEIYNELIRDLTQIPGANHAYLDVDESAELGPIVRNIHTVDLASASEGTSQFHQAFARRTETQTDFGSARNFASIVVTLDLVMKGPESPGPNRSRFTIVLTPGLEKLSEDSGQIRLREGPTLSKSIITLSQVVASLANQPHPDRVINYTDSRLTYLLRDELGGNCKTRLLLCLRPHSDSSHVAAAVRLVSQVALVKNFPILNDPFAQSVITQYRARVLHLQQQLGMGAGLAHPHQLHDISEELRRLQTENLELRDKNERMHLRLDQLQGKFGNLASTKTDLSAQLLMTEEEKLKVSKTLVEMQIENNKLKEEVEAAKFELTNKILQLENQMMECEIQRDRHAKAAKIAKERLSELEKDRKTLADEYVALKSNYVAVTRAHEKEVSMNEELSLELLNLVNAKAVLMRQIDTMSPSEPVAEIERIRNIVTRMSRRAEDILGSQKDRDNIEKTLFGPQRSYNNEMDRLRAQNEEDLRKLEKKLNAANRELRETRNTARDRQKNISEINAQTITLRNENENLKCQNNRLQHKLKDVTDEFRSRLVKYVEDIADYVDKESKQSRRGAESMRQYVDGMIKDMKKAHKVREEQLSNAAHNYKKQMEKTTRKHEELLVCYRELRHQMEAKGFDDLDLGPDEHHLMLTDPELQSKQQKEINRLREDLNQALGELESLRLRARIDGYTGKETEKAKNSKQASETQNWSTLRKQLHEFTVTTQRDLEEERASLMGRNAMLEEQVHELQGYIDSHLDRYKDEIVRLRQMLGMNGAGGFASPGPLRNSHQPPRR